MIGNFSEEYEYEYEYEYEEIRSKTKSQTVNCFLPILVMLVLLLVLVLVFTLVLSRPIPGGLRWAEPLRLSCRPRWDLAERWRSGSGPRCHRGGCQRLCR